jgi:hypothetical protein
MLSFQKFKTEVTSLEETIEKFHYELCNFSNGGNVFTTQLEATVDEI